MWGRQVAGEAVTCERCGRGLLLRGDLELGAVLLRGVTVFSKGPLDGRLAAQRGRAGDCEASQEAIERWGQRRRQDQSAGVLSTGPRRLEEGVCPWLCLEAPHCGWTWTQPGLSFSLPHQPDRALIGLCALCRALPADVISGPSRLHRSHLGQWAGRGMVLPSGRRSGRGSGPCLPGAQGASHPNPCRLPRRFSFYLPPLGKPR